MKAKLEGFEGAAGNLKELFEKVKDSWIEYVPGRENARVVAIDSGWNYRLYTGFYVYAMKAAGVDEAANMHYPMTEVDVLSGDPYNAGLTPDIFLKYRAEMHEHEIAYRVSGEADLALVDGSMMARLADVSNRAVRELQVEYMAFVKPLMGNDRLAFISKYSQDKSLFEGALGDIYYINQATRSMGYVGPQTITRNGAEFSIFYARLSEHANALHVEVPAPIDESYIRWFIDVLHETAIAGYPFALRLAHKVVSLPDGLMDSLCRAAGLTGWMEAREVLGA